MNHVRCSGSKVRWPRDVRWKLFVHQELSRERSAKSTGAHCWFCPVSGYFHGFEAWVGQTSTIQAGNAQNTAFRTTLKAHFQRGSKLNHGLCSHVRPRATCFTLNHVDLNLSNSVYEHTNNRLRICSSSISSNCTGFKDREKARRVTSLHAWILWLQPIQDGGALALKSTINHC